MSEQNGMMFGNRIRVLLRKGDYIMRYCVTYKIDARFITVVEAENIEEANIVVLI